MTTRSVSIAGKPAQVGGSVASVLGFIILTVGLTTALALGLLFAWLFPGTLAPWVLSLPVALLSLVFGIATRVGGKRLTASGKDSERQIREEAVLALAGSHQGNLRAETVANALSLTVRESDALLTAMANSDPDRIILDVDDHGQIHYRFPQLAMAYRVRVEAAAQSPNGPARVNATSSRAEHNDEMNSEPLVAFAEFAREQVRRATSRH
jgi:hypothetical protein